MPGGSGTGAAWLFDGGGLFLCPPAGTRVVYYEAAAVIVMLILLGRWLEARARATGEAIRKLVGLRAKTARVETRRRGGNADRRDRGRRHAASAPRREDRGGWRGPDRPVFRRRKHDHRRAVPVEKVAKEAEVVGAAR